MPALDGSFLLGSLITLAPGLHLGLSLLINDVIARKCLGHRQRISGVPHTISFRLSHSTFLLISHGFSHNFRGKSHGCAESYMKY
ncbi:hypothetical protein BT93_C0929 [Corymbia citriodora subsp. variegata]|nr:hypothetical protein BT93_C0929 [Corymbia citriodora subsp. variegata]